MLLDLEHLKRITVITCTILRDNFFYDKEALARFLKRFYERVKDEYHEFEDLADEGFKTELRYDYIIRLYFTSYFASSLLHESLTKDCFFTQNELELFENILPKYTGEKPNELKTSEQRTHNRELSKGLQDL
jgi:hypothetical protein